MTLLSFQSFVLLKFLKNEQNIGLEWHEGQFSFLAEMFRLLNFITVSSTSPSKQKEQLYKYLL